MHPRQTGIDAFLPEPVECGNGLSLAAHLTDEGRGLVDGKDRHAIDLVVVRQFEIILDQMVGDPVEYLRRNRLRPVDLAFVGVGRIEVGGHHVVGPHQVELHLPVVLRLQETLVQHIFQKRTVIVPIPVKNESIDPVFEGRSDFPLLHLRIGLVQIAPQRDVGLTVPVEFGTGLVNGLPFTDSVRENPNLRKPGIVVVSRPDERSDIVFGGRRSVLPAGRSGET